MSSYIPISGDASEQESNIAEQNKTEIFFGTDDNNVVELEHAVYVDPMIVGGVVSVPPIWRENDGTFVLDKNNDVIYEPVTVTVRGKKARNLTDYAGKEKPVFNEFSPARRNYEYYVSGRQISFNTNIDLEITVRYYILPDVAALSIRLYRTDRSTDTITPNIYGYSLFLDNI